MSPGPNRLALVTGATGFIGGHLAGRLVQEGWSVRVLARDPRRLSATVADRVEVVAGTLSDGDVLRDAVRGASVVFHCAANASTWDGWASYYSANVTGVEHLLAAIGQHNPGLSRLVHLSTVDVYGFPTTACTEDCPLARSGFGYGDTKAMGEALVGEFGKRSGLPVTILRPCNVIGPGSPFIRRIGAALKSGLMLKVDGGRANAGVLDIDCLLDYMLWAATADAAAGRCYNVRDAHDANWSEVIDAMRASLGASARGRVVDLPFRAADSAAWCSEAWHRVFMPGREPSLHRLIVRLFGRTCGHSAERIRADSGIGGEGALDRAIGKSMDWFGGLVHTHH